MTVGISRMSYEIVPTSWYAVYWVDRYDSESFGYVGDRNTEGETLVPFRTKEKAERFAETLQVRHTTEIIEWRRI